MQNDELDLTTFWGLASGDPNQAYELIRAFFLDLADFRRGMESGDRERQILVAGRLKEAADCLGAGRLARLCRQIEQHATAGQLAHGAVLYAEGSQRISKLKAAFRTANFSRRLRGPAGSGRE